MSKSSKKIEKYVLIDTDVLINCCLSSIKKEDVEVLKKFKTKLTIRRCKLLLPEVVEIEFNRIIDREHGVLQKTVDEFRKNFKKFLSKVARDELKKISESFQVHFEQSRKLVDDIFSHSRTDRIALNPDIILAAQRRALRGDKPYRHPHNRDLHGAALQSDCLVIESVAHYLKEKKDYKLILCTNNERDYKKNGSEEVIIDPSISSLFKKFGWYKYLYTMLNREFRENIKAGSLSIFGVQGSLSSGSPCVLCGMYHIFGTACSKCDRCGLTLNNWDFSLGGNRSPGRCSSCQNYQQCISCGVEYYNLFGQSVLNDGRCDDCRSRVSSIFPPTI